jgi:hypothetical protein
MGEANKEATDTTFSKDIQTLLAHHDITLGEAHLLHSLHTKEVHT